MTGFESFVNDKFGTGEAGKFKAGQAFGVSQATIYNWCNSKKHFIYDAGTEWKVIEVKKELIK